MGKTQTNKKVSRFCQKFGISSWKKPNNNQLQTPVGRSLSSARFATVGGAGEMVEVFHIFFCEPNMLFFFFGVQLWKKFWTFALKKCEVMCLIRLWDSISWHFWTGPIVSKVVNLWLFFCTLRKTKISTSGTNDGLLMFVMGLKFNLDFLMEWQIGPLYIGPSPGVGYDQAFSGVRFGKHRSMN